MPPKRKEPEHSGTATDPSPPKRVTRSTGQRIQPDHETPRTRKRRINQTSPKSVTTLSPQRQSNPHRTKPPPEGDTSDEPDELNLSPPKPLVPPSTPGPRPALRMVMDCVEITTPRGITPRAGTFIASPSIHSTSGMKPMAASIPRIYATPSRQLRNEPMSPLASAKVPQRPSTPSRVQPLVILQASPSRPRYQPDNVPATPGRINARPSSPKKGTENTYLPFLVKLPNVLPPHLVPFLRLQKRAILTALQSSTSSQDVDGEPDPSTNTIAYAQLRDLLHGTSTRGEGNSCLLLGPRGSGKTSLVERAVRNLPESPIVLRLSGHAQHNDRLALREIARQLSQQTGKSFLRDADEDSNEEESNPFIDPEHSKSLPPPSHLPALISVLPTLSRPTVVILDGFDLFAHHARQSLLYCLLDTVQSCKVGQGSNGLAVIGITSRIDTINLLEKRVKSRFSGRMIRSAPPSNLPFWISISRRFLDISINGSEEWGSLWSFAVQKFLEDRSVSDILKDTFALTRDVRMLKQMLTTIVVDLKTNSPFPTAAHIAVAVSTQRLREKFSNLQGLSYPSICLLIAAMHAQSVGHDMVTFEMLYDAFREQFRASSAAPIQIEGGSIGMARCTREVLMRSFEDLAGARMFVSVAAASSNIAPEFVRYRCLVERAAVKQAVSSMGQTNLKKWLNKGT